MEVGTYAVCGLLGYESLSLGMCHLPFSPHRITNNIYLRGVAISSIRNVDFVPKSCPFSIPFLGMFDSDEDLIPLIQSSRGNAASIVQALPPRVYEPFCSLGFSLLVVSRPHTYTQPMRWLFLKWIHNPENYVFCFGPTTARGFQGYGSSCETVTSWHDHVQVWPSPKIGTNLGNSSTHTQPRSGTRLPS